MTGGIPADFFGLLISIFVSIYFDNNQICFEI